MTPNVNAKQTAQIVFSEKTAQGDITPCAYLDLRNPTECILEQDKTCTWLTVALPAEVMDKLALAWCKQRNLTVVSQAPAA